MGVKHRYPIILCNMTQRQIHKDGEEEGTGVLASSWQELQSFLFF